MPLHPLIHFTGQTGPVAVAAEHVAGVYPEYRDERRTVLLFSSGKTLSIEHPAQVVTELLNQARAGDTVALLLEGAATEVAA